MADPMPSAPLSAPAAETPCDGSAPQDKAPAWLKSDSLLPLMGERIASMLGLKLSAARSERIADDQVWLIAGEFRFAGARVWLAIAQRDAMALMDSAMGGDGDLPEDLPEATLKPGSASWGMLSAQLVAALQPLFAERCQQPLAAEPALTPTALGAHDYALPLTLESGPSGFQLLLAGTVGATPKIAAPAQPATETRVLRMRRWQTGVQDLCLDVELPISMQLCAQQMELGQLLALGVGDTIALPPVTMLKMIVAGQDHGRLPLGGAGHPLMKGENQ